MSKSLLQLLPHQVQALNNVKGKQCAFYHDMGLGKTFTGAEQLMRYKENANLVVCQISKVKDWIDHFNTYYDLPVYDLTRPKQLNSFVESSELRVGVINYDKLARRPQLFNLPRVATIFDESSMLKNEKAARTKAATNFKFAAIILLSGTPMGGKYEELWTQCRFLGWNISKSAFWNRYVITRELFPAGAVFPIKTVTGYKNIDELKLKLREHGAQFLRANDVVNLPAQIFQTLKATTPRVYNEFLAKYYVMTEDREFIGDQPTTRLTYARILASAYNPSKIQIVKDLLVSTHDRLVIFYNFNLELSVLVKILEAEKRPYGYVNGSGSNLEPFNQEGGILLCQSAAGSKGLNLQQANKLVIFSPPLSGEDYMQMLKRIHRIGQQQTCFYYFICAEGSIEENIYKSLKRKEDYTIALFLEDTKKACR